MGQPSAHIEKYYTILFTTFISFSTLLITHMQAESSQTITSPFQKEIVL